MIGYGNPPKSTQFKKGQSGNPKGRPRKVITADTFTTIADVEHRALHQTVRVKTPSGSKKMSIKEAVVQKRINMAIQGNRLVSREILHREELREQAKAQSDQNWSDHLRDLKYRHQAVLDRHAANRTEPPHLLPHPADIIFDHKTGYYVLEGPYDADMYKTVERTLVVIEHMLVWFTIHEREGTGSGKAKANLFLILAQLYERTLPPSQVWSDIKWTTTMMDFGGMRQRELIKTEKVLAAKIATPIRPEPNYLRLAQREKIFTVIDGLIERFGQTCANLG